MPTFSKVLSRQPMSASRQVRPSSPPSRGTRRRWLKLAVAAALVLGLVVWHGSRRLPASADSGNALNSRTQPSADERASRRLRLATYNIHSGRGFDGRTDLARIAANLEGLDFVGLNEVRGGWLRQPDQAEQLASAVGTDWLFAPTEWRWWHNDFGNGVLSRIPVSSWQRIPLPARASRACRNAVLLRSQISGRPLNLLVTHVEDSQPRADASQLQAVVDLFMALEPPAVLLGDLNADRNQPQLQRLLRAAGVVDALEGLPAGKRRIDWIIVRGLECVARGMQPAGASDHPQYWAEVELK